MSPRHRTPRSPEQVETQRRLIRESLDRQGLSVTELAARIDRKLETVRLYLGDPAYKTRRDPSSDFLRRVERVLRLRLIEPRTASQAPPPAVLKIPPDLRLKILRFLTQAGAADADQLMRLADLSRSGFNRAVQPMLTEKLVTRFRQAPVSGLSHGQPQVYALAAEGAKLMTRHLGRPVHAAVHKGQLKAQILISHNLLVAEVAVRLVLRLGGVVSDLSADSDARGAVQVTLGKGIAIEPDLLVLLTREGQARAEWYEIETGSQTQVDVARKVKAAEVYRQSGAFAERWATNRLRMHWIGKDENHARRLREWVGALRPSTMALFTSWDYLEAQDIDAPIWLAINGTERVSLLEHMPLPAA